MKVGQKIYLKAVNNAARGRKPEDLITEETVATVGRKYFTIEGWNRDKFSIEERCNVSNYSPNYEVYFSKQEIFDEAELKDKTDKIRNAIGQYGDSGLSLELTRTIYDLIMQKSTP